MKTQDILKRLQKYGIQVYDDQSGLLPFYWFIHPDGKHFHVCATLNLFFSMYISSAVDYWSVLNPDGWSSPEFGNLSFLSSPNVKRVI